MSTVNTVRKLAVGLTPPILYPFILKAVNYKLIHGLLQGTGTSLYSPTWHTIEKGKLKGIRIFIDSSSGEWEHSMTTGTYDEYFLNVLTKLNLKKKVFFDIGAHIGYSSLCFSRLSGGEASVYAFEPNQYNRARLEMHIKGNGKYGDAIRVFPQAISDKNGVESFVFTNNVDGWTSSGSFLDSAHTIMEHGKYEKEYGFSRTKVKTVTLDSFTKEHRVIPDVIKIDVEGAEHLVLEGARQMLKKHKPLFLIELHSVFATVRSLGVLYAHGYSVDILSDEDGRVFIAATCSEKRK